MSVPQDSKTRRSQKKRRTRKLAQWREKQLTNAAAAPAPAVPKKRG